MKIHDLILELKAIEKEYGNQEIYVQEDERQVRDVYVSKDTVEDTNVGIVIPKVW